MSLRSLTYAGIIAGLVLFAGIMAFVLPPLSRDLAQEVAALDAKVKTRSLGQEITRRLYADWEELSYLAQRLPEIDTDLARARLDGFRGGESVSWAGFADVEGTVIVASDGMLEGVSVAERPWFVNGLNGGFAGDVHQAVLLQALLAPDAAEPLRFIDLALPVAAQDGTPLGVLGVHIQAEWLEDFLREGAAVRGIEAILVSADGSVAAASTDLTDADRANRTLRAAAAGAEGDLRETWSGGVEATSFVLPDLAYEDLPNFGWRLIGRVDGATYGFVEQTVLRQAVTLAAAAAVIFLAVATALAFFALRPISALAETAERLSKGEEAYPPESRSSAEARQLSAALARISGRAG